MKEINITRACAESDIGAIRDLLSMGHGINAEFIPTVNLLFHSFTVSSNNQFISYLIQNEAKFPPAALRCTWISYVLKHFKNPKNENCNISCGRLFLCYKALGYSMSKEFRPEDYNPYVLFMKHFLHLYKNSEELSFIPEVFGISVEEITQEYN